MTRFYIWTSIIGFSMACAGSSPAPETSSRQDPPAKVRKRGRSKIKGVGPRGLSGPKKQTAGIEKLRSAKKKATDGDLAGAISDIQAAIAENSKLTEAYLLLGSLLDMAGESQRSIVVYQKGLDAGAEPAPLHHALGMAALENNQQDKAIASLESADKLTKPPSADLKADLAYAYLLAGKNEQGLNLAQKAYELGPRSFAATYTLGEAYLRAKDLSKAIESFEKALKLSPSEVRSHGRLAQVLNQAGKHEHAKQEFLRLLEKNPKDIKSHIALTGVWFDLKKPREAVKSMERALQLAPAHPQVLELMAQAYTQAGMNDKAKAVRRQIKKGSTTK